MKALFTIANFNFYRRNKLFEILAVMHVAMYTFVRHSFVTVALSMYRMLLKVDEQMSTSIARG